jgi:hypothetical protein
MPKRQQSILDRYMTGHLSTSECREFKCGAALIQWRVGALVPTRKAIERFLAESNEPRSRAREMAIFITTRIRNRCGELERDLA